MCTRSKRNQEKTRQENLPKFLTLFILKRIIRYKSINKGIMLYRMI